MRLHVFALAALVCLGSALAASGKKLDLIASTVSELQEQVASAQGLRPDRQAVFFKGKKLSPEDTLAEAGVQDGDAITVTAARGRSAVAESRVAGGAALSMELDDIDSALDAMPAPSSVAPAGMGGGMGGMDPMSMLGGAQQKEVLEALSDPKKLEQSRQMLLKHPMYKQMSAQVPGLAEAVSDPKKWKETMEQAREMMGQVANGGPQSAELKQAMEQGMKAFGGQFGGPGGAGGLEAMLGGGVRKDGPAAKLGVDAELLSRAFGHTFGVQVATLGLSLPEAVRGMVESTRAGKKLPMDAAAYDEQMSRLLEKAGVAASEGAIAHKGAKKVRARAQGQAIG
ncbi:hypothetical protein T492DRAFT_1145949 [Pavlovales sp. CCMP2436]|nr:hypothetical protein T492DRAFT_1145949 [Pavlovales sp. CCMP2436]